MIPISGSFLTAAIILALLAIVVVLLAGGIVVTMMVLRREKSQQRRSSREIEKVNALATAGKITAEEASQLRQAVMPYAMPVVTPPPDKHIKVSAILNIVYGFLKIIIVALSLYGLSFLSFSILAKSPATADMPFWRIVLLPSSILLLVLIVEVVRIIAGFAMQKRRAWARTTLIVLSGLSLVSFPMGTALGCYTLWVLIIREGAAAWFEPPAV